MRVLAVLLASGSLLTFEAQAQPDPIYTLSMSSATGLPGESVEISVFLDIPRGLEVAGVSFSVCASPGDGSLVSIPCLLANDCIDNGFMEMGAALAATNNGQGPFLFVAHTTTVPSEGWVFATIISPFGMDYLPPQENAELIIVHYDLLGPIGSVSELTFCEIGFPKVLIAVGLAGGVEVIPETTGGTITIGSVLFIRGDVDANGTFNGLVDGLFLLNSTFVPGSPPPPCLESADVDGNGKFNALADAIFALRCQFLPGSPCPTDPFPVCGADPDPASTLGCDDFPGCP